jgi:mannose-6-phosphate isomerase-like protein (cupin superfamily)
MTQPTISRGTAGQTDPAERFSARGQSFSVHEWRGSGPAMLHVHHADDEAWVVLEGVLRFRFLDETIEVGAGGTVFVPAGVAHAYESLGARYLIVLTPRVAALIEELQKTPDRRAHAGIYRKYESELIEDARPAGGAG